MLKHFDHERMGGSGASGHRDRLHCLHHGPGAAGATAAILSRVDLAMIQEQPALPDKIAAANAGMAPQFRFAVHVF